MKIWLYKTHRNFCFWLLLSIYIVSCFALNFFKPLLMIICCAGIAAIFVSYMIGLMLYDANETEKSLRKQYDP
jgi:hypothetical protein